MANSKISALAAVTSVGSTDEFVSAVGGATKKITGANLKTAMFPSAHNAQAAIIAPTSLGWVAVASGGGTANRVQLTRFVPDKDFTVTSMKFRTNTAGTGNVDVGIYDSTLGTLLKSSGSTASKKGANTTQTVTLSSTLALTAGTVYYAAWVTDTSDGTVTACSFTGSLEQLIGSTIGVFESAYKDAGAFPLPASITSPTVTGTIGTVFALI